MLLPDWMIASGLGVAAFLVGVVLTLLATRERRLVPAPTLGAPHGDVEEAESDASEEPSMARSAPLVALLGQALREPLRGLRRSSLPPELVWMVERVAWQARMLAARPRPMQATPTSPISLLQEAAQQVEALRLGKIGVSWGLLTRQPVHVDPERTRAAFRELLQAAADAAGEGARLAIRIHEGKREGYPVAVEIELGSRGAEPERLAVLVARHLLEIQGLRLQIDGPLTRVELRSLPPASDAFE